MSCVGLVLLALLALLATGCSKKVEYACDDGRKVVAEYFSDSTEIELDGRTFTLEQVGSAEGSRGQRYSADLGFSGLTGVSWTRLDTEAILTTLTLDLSILDGLGNATTPQNFLKNPPRPVVTRCRER